MTNNEKKVMWYARSEIDKFKRDAATVAGMKLARFKNEFVMLGNFDDCETTDKKPTYISSDAATAGEGSSFASSDKRHHNLNEHGIVKANKEMCKRGLAFHFSRTRKRSRIIARSAVLTWQH